MALLERVATLIRANLNDLIDKAEDPEKMLKQLILDMQNQLMQVKTQVAIAVADEHLLAKKKKENETVAMDWFTKAELAVEKHQDDLAKRALERAINYKQTADSFTEQLEDQKHQVESLKDALRRLEQKLAEAKSQADLLILQHRRARTMERAADAQMSTTSGVTAVAFDRLRSKVVQSEAVGQAHAEIANEDLQDRLAALTREDEVNHLLAEIKARKGLTASSSAATELPPAQKNGTAELPPASKELQPANGAAHTEAVEHQ